MIKNLCAFLLFASLAFSQTKYVDGNLTVEGTINHCGADTGAGSAYVCANQASGIIAAYRDGVVYSFRATHSNAAASTLAIDGLAAVLIKKQGGTTDLASGDIAANMEIAVKYNGTSGFFELQTPSANAPGGVITIIEDINLPTAVEINGLGPVASGWDLVAGASPPLAAGGGAGANNPLAFIGFPNTNSPTILHRRLLPSTWTGNIDVAIHWIDQCCGSGNAKWNVDLACATNNSTTGVYYDAGFSNMTFNAASSVTTASNSRLNASKVTVLAVNNCVPSGQLWVRIARDNTVGSNLAGNALVEYVVLTLRRTNQ